MEKSGGQVFLERCSRDSLNGETGELGAPAVVPAGAGGELEGDRPACDGVVEAGGGAADGDGPFLEQGVGEVGA